MAFLGFMGFFRHADIFHLPVPTTDTFSFAFPAFDEDPRWREGECHVGFEHQSPGRRHLQRPHLHYLLSKQAFQQTHWAQMIPVPILKLEAMPFWIFHITKEMSRNHFFPGKPVSSLLSVFLFSDNKFLLKVFLVVLHLNRHEFSKNAKIYAT